MKMVKSLILGSAAGLVAMSGAQAADLPVKAKAVEYVRICSLYGAGFFYIPGTDTCIKIGGYLRADLNIHGGNSGAPFWSGDGGIQDRYANQYNDYARMALTIDTRTATEYGVVRTFGQIDTTFATTGAGNSIGVQSSVQSAALGGAYLPNYAGAGYTTPEFAFIQFAGFTFGKSASAYNTPWHGFPGNNTAYLVGGYDTVTGINNVQYTANFGNGVSGTIGLDASDASGYNRTQVFNATLVGPGAFAGAISLNAAVNQGAATTANQANGNLGLYGAPSSLVTVVGTSYAGSFAPDVVGNIKVDQAWGLFQVSAAAHQVMPGYWGAANTINASTLIGGTNQTAMEGTGHPDAKWGGAVMAALQIKNLPTGAGDDVKVEASYGVGATKYILGTAAPLGGSFYMTKASNAPGNTAGTIGIGAITDGVYGGFDTPMQAGLQLTRGFGFRGAFNHNWSPEWSSSLFGGFAMISYNQTAKDLWCASYAGTLSSGAALPAGVAAPTGKVVTAGAGYSCDPGFTMSQIGLTTRWTPVKNLTFSSEVMYSYLKTNMTGQAIGTTSSAFPVPGGATAVWNYGNVGTVNVNLRVQRNF
jgi:Porin subfamily